MKYLHKKFPAFLYHAWGIGMKPYGPRRNLMHFISSCWDAWNFREGAIRAIANWYDLAAKLAFDDILLTCSSRYCSQTLLIWQYSELWWTERISHHWQEDCSCTCSDLSHCHILVNPTPFLPDMYNIILILEMYLYSNIDSKPPLANIRCLPM